MLDFRDKFDLDKYSENGESCKMDPNIEEDDDEPFKNEGLGFWVDDATSSSGTGGRNSGSKSSGQSFTNTSESEKSSKDSDEMKEYRLGGSKFNQ